MEPNNNLPHPSPKPVSPDNPTYNPPAQPPIPISPPAIVQPTANNPVNPITIPPNVEKPKATSRDKVIGVVIGLIGLLGIVGAASVIMDFYNQIPGSGTTPPTTYLIVPLLFLYSGYYYITGLNAQRIQRKQGGGTRIKKNYQKFHLVEALLAVLIVGCVAYPLFYKEHQDTANQATAKPASSSDKATLDKKRAEIANNLAAAEKKYQDNNQGVINPSLDSLKTDYTDPATGEHYMFSGYITEPSPDGQPYAINAIHLGQDYKCNPNGSGYMISAPTSFAFAIERETMPPICFDFHGKP